MMEDKINVFYVEDHMISREGMRLLLSKDHALDLVGDASNLDGLLKGLNQFRIDIVLLDIYLDGTNLQSSNNGLDLCAHLRKIKPAVKVVAHSGYDDADRVSEMMRAGASGFVSKKAREAELVKALKLVHKGRRYICNETCKGLKNVRSFLSDLNRPLENKYQFFSRREGDVLSLLAKGLSTKQIAARLFITSKTVESHRTSLIHKAKVKNTAQLMAYAFLRGLIK